MPDPPGSPRCGRSGRSGTSARPGRPDRPESAPPEQPPGGRRLRLAVTQWHATADPAENLPVAVDLIGEAGRAGADLVLLPENGLLLGTGAQMRDGALGTDAPEIDRLRQAAAAAGCAVVLGGFKRRDPRGHIANTALVIDGAGRIAGGYDKIHLFDARVAGQTYHASAAERPGESPVLLDLAGTLVGLTICYDVRFPELYRRLALAGAQVFLVPSAFLAHTGRAHWEVLLRARAIENGAFLAASATARGSAADPVPTYGHALVVDPWGTVLADLGTGHRAVRTVELDLAQVDRIRADLPVLRGVRPEAYRRRPVVIEACRRQEEPHE